MDVFNSVIYSAVEFSNMLSCLAVLSCTGAVFMFLMKATIAVLAQREEALAHQTSFTSQNALQVPRLNMTRVHIPFTFRLVEAGNHSCDEIQIVVTSQVKYTIQAFWGVSIRDLHMFLWKPWIEIKERVYSSDGAILSKSVYQELAIDSRDKGPHTDQKFTLTSPKPPMALGAPPRLAYPLVLFLIKDSESSVNHPDDTFLSMMILYQVAINIGYLIFTTFLVIFYYKQKEKCFQIKVLLVNVIHLKDPVCPLPTSVLAQYLKQASGQLSCLKQLYLATGDSILSDEPTSVPSSSLSLAEPVACAGSSGPLLCSDGPQTEQLCVVCHYFPLSRALLPCRHTCICAVCFSKLTRCPMCRSPISSYFCIRSEDYIPPGIFEQRSSKTKNVHWLDALNDRLTDFLGFR